MCSILASEDSRFRGLFIYFGPRILVVSILKRIETGDTNLPSYLRQHATPRACANALNQFLRSLQNPLLTSRVQNLILSENKGICPRTIALDALNLLSEELEGPNRTLFVTIMNMIKKLTTVGSLRPTEIRVSYGPYLLIPLFFTPNEKIAKNWGTMADILNEMILCFDDFLRDGYFETTWP